MIDLLKCDMLTEEEPDPDGCEECGWEPFRCHEAMAALLIELRESEQ